MKGYIIELYKFIISNNESDETPRNKDRNLRKDAYITFGDFDRMAISTTTAFSRMRDMSRLSRTWKGDRQTILLYELSDDNEVIYKDTDEAQGFFRLSQGKEKKCEELFIGVTILQFKNNPTEQKQSATEYINACRKKILDIVSKNNAEKSKIHCSVFGVLGTYGVAVIWTADQYTEVLEQINEIKGKEICSDEENEKRGYPYLSAYTIFAKNNFSEEIPDERIHQIKGNAMLHMTLQTNLDPKRQKELREKLEDNAQFHSVGEHDLIIMVETKKIYNLFENNKILDRGGSFYKGYILQMNTKLCREVTQRDEGVFAAEIDLEQDVTIMEEEGSAEQENNEKMEEKIKASYDSLRGLFFQKFPKTAGMVDSLDLLYGDYLSKTASVSNKMWTDDFKYQFYTILEVIQKNLEYVTRDNYNDISKTVALEDIKEILNCFEYQIIHIAESNNFVLETPKCHLRYTGQNNLTLYAYFGIVKDILTLIYSMQDMTRQAEIIPLISADTVPIIKSDLFAEYENSFARGVLKLNLPMMALYNIPIYTPYLYHEIFHYAVPRDRVIRNWYKGNILMVQAIKKFVICVVNFCCKMEDMKFAEGLVDSVLMPFIYETVIEKRCDEIPAILIKGELKSENLNESREDENYDSASVINETGCPWRRYEKLLFQKIYGYFYSEDKIDLNLKKNIAYQVLSYFYKCRDDILIQAEKWIRHIDFRRECGNKKTMIAATQSFLKRLEALVKNFEGKKSEAYFALIESLEISIKDLIQYDELNQISISINEAVCDCAMVELAGMGAAEYLVSYVKIQNDLLKSKEDDLQIQDMIRIGVVLHKIYNFDEKEENVLANLRSEEEKFVDLYIGMYFSIHRFGEAKDCNYLNCMVKHAREWFNKFIECYSIYANVFHIQISMVKAIVNQYNVKDRMKVDDKQNYEFLRLNCYECYEAMKIYGCNIRLCFEEGISVFSEELLGDIKKYRQTFREKIFAVNVKIIQDYQQQKTFGEMRKICKEHFKGDVSYKLNPKDLRKLYGVECSSSWSNIKKGQRWEKADYTYEISGIEELCNAIKNVSLLFKESAQKVYTNKVYNFWYRGQENIKYKLLPLAMRRLGDTVYSSGELYRYQRSKYEEFKFRLDDASERIDTSSYTSCDYLALMQHYGTPTVYLDWSENAITALYFALESYIDPKKAAGKNHQDAVLYIMHPNLYNEARKDLIKKVSSTSGKMHDKVIKENCKDKTSTLPNLSVRYNQDKYYMFLLGETSEADIPDQPLKEENLTENSESLLYLPLAIYSSRANMRVRNQYGMFMAFNLFTPPDKEDKFDYMELEKIQEAYLKLFRDKEPFMYKIVIKNESKQRIADWLKAIGMSKDMIYPELSNIGERI